MECKACGAPLARSARGHTSEYCNDRCRKRGPRVREAATQLSLEFEVSSDVTAPVPEIQNDTSERDPATLTSYSRETLRHLGAHDQARRAWLREWARSRDYRASWFTVHGRYSGYYQTGIPAGEEGWTRFLERGGSYDVYCLFVAAFTPDIPLQCYLEDASARGEIKLGDDLLWKPH